MPSKSVDCQGIVAASTKMDLSSGGFLTAAAVMAAPIAGSQKSTGLDTGRHAHDRMRDQRTVNWSGPPRSALPNGRPALASWVHAPIRCQRFLLIRPGLGIVGVRPFIPDGR